MPGLWGFASLAAVPHETRSRRMWSGCGAGVGKETVTPLTVGVASIFCLSEPGGLGRDFSVCGPVVSGVFLDPAKDDVPHYDFDVGHVAHLYRDSA